MGRLLWTTAFTSLLIALIASSVNASYVSDQDDACSSDDAIKSPATDVEPILSKNRIRQAREDFIDNTREFVKTLVEIFKDSVDIDYKSQTTCLLTAVDTYCNNLMKNSVLRDILPNGIIYFLVTKQGEFSEKFEVFIRDHESLMIKVLNDLNLTDNPRLFTDILETLNNYPQGKEDLKKLLKSKLEVEVYGKYVGLSEGLKRNIKEKIYELIEYLERLLYEANENKSDKVVDDFIVLESGNLIDRLINKLINKIFVKINKRNKKKIENYAEI